MSRRRDLLGSGPDQPGGRAKPLALKPALQIRRARKNSTQTAALPVTLSDSDRPRPGLRVRVRFTVLRPALAAAG